MNPWSEYFKILGKNPSWLQFTYVLHGVRHNQCKLVCLFNATFQAESYRYSSLVSHTLCQTHAWENISHTLVLKTACGLTYTVHTYNVHTDFPFKQPFHAGTDPRKRTLGIIGKGHLQNGCPLLKALSPITKSNLVLSWSTDQLIIIIIIVTVWLVRCWTLPVLRAPDFWFCARR